MYRHNVNSGVAQIKHARKESDDDVNVEVNQNDDDDDDDDDDGLLLHITHQGNFING